MKRIGIDASGGNFGYSEIVPGAIKASEIGLYEIVVYGNLDIMKKDFFPFRHFPRGLRIDHCDRPNSELAKAFADLDIGFLDAIITASKNQRLLAAAKDYRQDGVLRPGLIAPFPIKGKTAYMLDVGATRRVKDPKTFLGWAKIGYQFLTVDLKIDEPKIGLLNIADESAYPELAEIHQALKSCQGYVGYAEPALFARGEIDLWLMEGFVGNILLKYTEEFFPLTLSFCCQELAGMSRAQLRLREMARAKLSYDAHLVSPLLGLTGKVFRVHGKCTAEQIAQSFQAVGRYL